MRIEILNTGTELLLGTTLNRHGAWIGQQLFPQGLRVQRQTTVPDGDAIREAISESVTRCDALIITGGLGPTSDDITRELTAELLGIELIEDEAAMRSIEAFFIAREKIMAPANRKQALAPVGADVLPNPNGTAPGIYIPPRLSAATNCAIFLLPGPPRELHPMFHAEVMPRLRALSGIEHVNEVMEMKFTGIGESEFHDGIDEQLAAMKGLEFGYCARPGEVDLRLIGSKETIGKARKLAADVFEKHLISENGDSLEQVVVRLLTEKNKTLAVAESCTGGLISSRLTDVPGSSAVLTHGFVSYANAAKTEMLGVPSELIAAHGAVSEEVARAMAEGALLKSGADVAVAVTGIAGPGGGSAEKPVGTVYLAIASKGGATMAFRQLHIRERTSFKFTVSQAALNLVRRWALKQ